MAILIREPPLDSLIAVNTHCWQLLLDIDYWRRREYRRLMSFPYASEIDARLRIYILEEKVWSYIHWFQLMGYVFARTGDEWIYL